MSTILPVKPRISASVRHTIDEHKSAQENEKSAQKVHRQRRTSPKTHAAHWLNKVSKPGGSGLYGVQIAHQGQRHRFPLQSADKAQAAERARDRYVHLVAHGWKDTLAKFKPETAQKSATVGALIESATRLSSARKESLTAYTQALRRLASGVVGLRDGRKLRLQASEWREKVDAIPLDKLTPAAVVAWKNQFLKANEAPEARNSAAISFNALLRNSKALLSKKIRHHIENEIQLPSPLWFEGVAREKEPSLRYFSKIDAGEILAAAHAELAVEQPEVYKALLLTLACGLRRSEADTLLWRQFDLDAAKLSIADTEHKALKSADSAGEIGLDAELVALLRGFRAKAKSEFVLESAPRLREAPKRHYRADTVFKTLLQWLKAKGVPGIRPIHTMRKEIGSIIATRDGIFSASRFLRHSNIGITAKLYADAKKPVAAGLGSLFTAPVGNVIQAEFKPAEKASKSKGKARRA